MTPRPTMKLRIYQSLKQDIVSGVIKPGEILNEAELARRYSAGKTPTREALLLLTHENLLEAMPRLGYVVSRLTIHDLAEIFSLRILLETEAIGLAAERIQPEEIALLEENNCREAQVYHLLSSTWNGQAAQLNLEFHTLIARAAGNARLVKLIGDLIIDLERALASDPFVADPTQHHEIIRSLKAGDKARAQQAMQAHLVETRLRIQQLF